MDVTVHVQLLGKLDFQGICDKIFHLKKSLLKHEQNHSGEKNHACGFCEKRFFTKGSRIIHERIHTGEQIYNCTKCERKFNQKFHLKRHEINQCIKQKSGPKKPWKNKNSNGSKSNQISKKNIPDEGITVLYGCKPKESSR